MWCHAKHVRRLEQHTHFWQNRMHFSHSGNNHLRPTSMLTESVQQDNINLRTTSMLTESVQQDNINLRPTSMLTESVQQDNINLRTTSTLTESVQQDNINLRPTSRLTESVNNDLPIGCSWLATQTVLMMLESTWSFVTFDRQTSYTIAIISGKYKCR